jgi:hypothetical protein
MEEKMSKYFNAGDVRKYTIVAAIVVCLLLAGLVLVSCSKGESVSKDAKTLPKGQYTTVMARCGLDKQSSTLICRRLLQHDETTIDGLITEKTKEGYTLVSTVTSRDKSGEVTAFTFVKN